MSLVESVRDRLLSNAPFAAVANGGVVLDPPTPGDPNVFGVDGDGIARIQPCVFVYESTEGRAGPFETSSTVYVHLACYAPTYRQCETIEKLARAALYEARLGEDSRHLRWFDARGATPDRGYDPPELYSLGRYQATGLWGTT